MTSKVIPIILNIEEESFYLRLRGYSSSKVYESTKHHYLQDHHLDFQLIKCLHDMHCSSTYPYKL